MVIPIVLKAIMKKTNSEQVKSALLIKGDRVKLFKGALAGYEGILSEDQKGKKVVLKISKSSMSLLIDVPREHVIKISDPHSNGKELTLIVSAANKKGLDHE